MKAQNRKKVFGADPTDKEASKSKVENRSGSRRPTTAGQTEKTGDQVQPKNRPPKGEITNHLSIVGVGASAGGLEAFTELLKHLPLDTGLGFVLVQHLDPQHESALTQLLTRATSMPVREVTNNLRVEANHVYVIPPNTNLGIAQGILKLQPREQTHMPHRSIDFFYEALAQDQRERAIGVILSGTATDGTLGLEAIKAEGGITFAQDDSAKYDSMPRSAVAAGCVDFVLSPKNIAKELARIAKHPYVAWQPTEPLTRSEGAPLPYLGRGQKVGRAVPSAPGTSEAARRRGEDTAAYQRANGFKKILLLLRNHSGLDFSLYKSATIQRRITRRMVLNKQNTLENYANFIRGNAKELDALYSDALISVTKFFRNPEAFEVLKRKVFPKLLQQRDDEPLRVWVLGCSTGQEAYSIAMAFVESAENAPHTRKLQVFATDLNDALLDRARHGLYAKTLVQDVTPERLRRFFVEEQAGYRVSKPLHEMVVFARQNLINDPPFSRMDLISCRNLLIYLEPSLQQKALSTFHYALKPPGFLFLGASESIGSRTDLFEPAYKKHKIYSKKAAPTPAFHLPVKKERGEHPSTGRRPPSPLPMRVGHGEGFRGELNAQREADRVTVNEFAPPGVLINAEFQILQFRGPTSPYLKLPTGKATFDVLKMAREGLMLPLRTAVNKAKKENKTARREHVRVQQNGKTRTVNVEVIPLKNLRERCFLILFKDGEKVKRPVPSAPSPKSTEPRAARPTSKNEESSRVADLERDLFETRDYVQSIQEQHEAANEELQASNEEVQSANEELQSLNEELETSKEEMESANEELTTVNEEMAHRNMELNHLNADLNNLYANVNMAIVVLTRDLIIRRFTAPAEKLFNLLATDVGRPLSGVRHNLVVTRASRTSDDAQRCGEDTAPYPVEDLVREVIDTVNVREREVRDKEGRWYALRVRPYMTLDNKVDGAMLMVVDVNTLKRSEQEIKRARDYAEAILGTARIPLAVLGADLRMNTANAAFYNTFKVTPADIEGRSLYDLGNGQWNIPRLRTLLEDILPRNSFFTDFEVTHDFPGIGRRTMLLDARRLQRDDGAPLLILLSIQDVTERLESQVSLRASELRFRRLFETAHDGVLLLDSASRKITDTNPFVAELLGYARHELVGKELWEIGLFKDEQASHAAFRGLEQSGFIHYDNLTVHTKVRQRLDVEFVSTVYHEQDRKVIQCHIRDITERKRAAEKVARLTEELEERVLERTRELKEANAALTRQAEELIRSNAELERFAYISSHDLQEPLRTISNFTQLLAKRYKGKFDAEADEYIGFVVDGASRMQQLIKDLLAYSRVSAREKRVELIDFEVLWTRANADLKTEIVKSQAVLTHDPLPTVRGDAVQLGQVLQNLLSNALKFRGPEPPRVHVSAKLTSADPNAASKGVTEWVFSVRDSGIGIEPQYAERVFVVFQRLHTQADYAGTGIGLAICKRIVEAHGGRIWVESRLGHGATFYFSIPESSMTRSD